MPNDDPKKTDSTEAREVAGGDCVNRLVRELAETFERRREEHRLLYMQTGKPSECALTVEYMKLKEELRSEIEKLPNRVLNEPESDNPSCP